MKSLARALPAINLKGASIESVGKINPSTLLGSGKIDEIQKKNHIKRYKVNSD